MQILRRSEGNVPLYLVRMHGHLQNHIPDVWRTFHTAPEGCVAHRIDESIGIHRNAQAGELRSWASIVRVRRSTTLQLQYNLSHTTLSCKDNVNDLISITFRFKIYRFVISVKGWLGTCLHCNLIGTDARTQVNIFKVSFIITISYMYQDGRFLR